MSYVTKALQPEEYRLWLSGKGPKPKKSPKSPKKNRKSLIFLSAATGRKQNLSCPPQQWQSFGVPGSRQFLLILELYRFYTFIFPTVATHFFEDPDIEIEI